MKRQKKIRNTRRKGGKGRQYSRGLRRSLAAVLLVTLFAAFLILTEPGKEIISVATGTKEVSAEEAEEAAEPGKETAEVPANEAEASAGEAAGEEPSESETPEEAVRLEDAFSLDMVPAFSGRAYADINGDVPFFTEEEMTSEAFHEYWPLDDLGRCTGAFACVGPETLPKEQRGDISEVKPSGWHRSEYSDIDGGLLFNRCHLIGHMLTGQDANERNLITGTRYMNTEGMLPFEESVLMYVEGTGHHVMYRVRPFYEGDNLIAAGVLMEARSVEDPLVQFCAFCYNVQPGFEIDYATGDNRRAKDSQRTMPEEDVQRSASEGEEDIERNISEGEEDIERNISEGEEDIERNLSEEDHYVLNINTHKFHRPGCESVTDMKEKNKKISEEDRETLIREGYSPCNRCQP